MSKKIKNKLNIIVVSALGENTGCALRAKYIAASLKNNNVNARYIKGINTKPFMLDFIITLFINVRILFIPSDIIIGCKPYPNIAIYMCIAKIIFRKKIIFDIDDMDTFRKGLIGKFGSLIQKPYPKHADIVTYHSHNLHKYIIEHFSVTEEKLYQLIQGVNLEYFHPITEDDNKLFDIWQKHFLIQNSLVDKNILLYIGHLNIACDLKSIFEILLMAIEEGLTDIRLVVIGGGDMLNHFKNLSIKMGLEEYIVFTGYIDYKDIIRYSSISNRSIVYYSDIKENYVRQSMKIRELLAMKKYVICNDIGDLKEFEEYTYQINAFSYNDMSKMITNTFLETLDDRNEKGYEYIKNNFDWNIIGKKFLNRIIN